QLWYELVLEPPRADTLPSLSYKKSAPRGAFFSTAYSLENLPLDNGLVTVGTCRDDVDRRADQLLDPRDIGAGVGGQLLQSLDPEGGLAPAGHFLVHRLQTDIAVGVAGGFQYGAVSVAVAHTDLDHIQAVEHVQLGQAQATDAVDLNCAAQDYGIEPAATAGATGSRTELVATLGQTLTDVIEQLSGERTRTYPGGVGLGDAQHVIQVQGTETGTGSRTASRGVGAGHVGIGTMVDVQQGALGTLEHDVGPFPAQHVQTSGHVFHQRLEPLGIFHCLIQRLLEIDGLDLVVMLQREVVVVQDLAQLGGKALAVEQVGYAQTPAGHLVL